MGSHGIKPWSRLHCRLRDAGAYFTISFSRLPKLQNWLDTQIVKPEQTTSDEAMAVG